MKPQWSGALFLLKRFIHDESGATAIEYGLMLSLIALAILVALTGFGDAMTDLFDGAMKTLGTAMS